MARVGEGIEGGVVRAVVLEEEPDEQAIRAVGGRPTERLVHDRHQSLALLAERFGEEELDPGPESSDPVGQDQGHLVAACFRKRGERGAEPHGSALVRAHAVVGLLDHRARPVEQRLEIDAEERGGHHAHVAQRSVAVPDGSRIEKRMPESAVSGQVAQWRARIRDRDELRARLGHGGCLDPRAAEAIEASVSAVSRCAGDDEERAHLTCSITCITVAGSVVSRVIKSGNPIRDLKVRPNTSAHAADAPMPSTMTWENCSRRISSANVRRPSMWVRMTAGAVSQPRRALTSVGSPRQRVASFV
jgi:hypothetical protein